MFIKYHQQFRFGIDFKYYNLSKPEVIQEEDDEDRIGQLFSQQ